MAKASSVRIGDREWTPTAWERMLAKADAASADYARRWPRVLRVRYEPKSSQIMLDLSNGLQLGVPADRLQGVADGTESERSDVVILGPNRAIEFPKLDQQFTVAGLLCGVFGNRAWMASLTDRRRVPKSSQRKSSGKQRLSQATVRSRSLQRTTGTVRS